MSVTLTPKRYRSWEWVFVCAGCGLLASSERSDATTCCTACRVRAHRKGSLKELQAIADAFDVRPAGILHSKAISALRPDLGDRIMSERKLKIEQIMPEVYEAFIKLAMAAARNP